MYENHSQDPEDMGRPEIYSRDSAKRRRLSTGRLDLPSFQRRRKKGKTGSSMNEEKRQAKVCAQSRIFRLIFIRNRIRHIYPATDVQCVEFGHPPPSSVAPRSQWRPGDARDCERMSPEGPRGGAANITRLHPPGSPDRSVSPGMVIHRLANETCHLVPLEVKEQEEVGTEGHCIPLGLQGGQESVRRCTGDAARIGSK